MHTRQVLIAHIEHRVGLSYASFVTNKLRFNQHILSKLTNSVSLPLFSKPHTGLKYQIYNSHFQESAKYDDTTT